MLLSQVMATPATMMVFAIANSDAEYLGNNNGSEFKSSFLFGDYMFEVQTDMHENICVDLYKLQADRDNNIAMHLNEEYTDATLISITRPMSHSLENAVVIVEELCYQIFQELDEAHMGDVKHALLGWNSDECYKQFVDTLNEVLTSFVAKNAKVDTSDYVCLTTNEDCPLYLNARQYTRFIQLRDSVAK